MKKLQRKAKQDPSDGKGDKDKEKDEKHHKSDTSSSDPHYFEGQSDDPFTPSSSQPLNPNMPYSPDGNHHNYQFHSTPHLIFIWFELDAYPTNSGESFCSSELSLEDSTTGLEGFDDSGPELHVQGMESQGPPDILPPYAQINPIDKLYLMQNSYFTDT